MLKQSPTKAALMSLVLGLCFKGLIFQLHYSS
jgi:hypothetical protein